MNKKNSLFDQELISFSIIIPNYNGVSFLSDCINSVVEAIQNCPQSKFELIFVDNGSKDNSVDIAKNITKNISRLDTKYLILNTNYGFAGAVNRGINKAKYPWVVILNNDLTMEPNWFELISNVIAQNQDQKVATFFGTALTKDGTKFESQGLDFKIQGKCLNISNGQVFSTKALKNYSSSALVWGAPASLVVYKKNIIQKVGLFDEDFFAYEEDVDLSFRLNRLGYKTLYIPKAISYHLGGGTSNRMGNFRARMDTKNWILLIIKNYSASEFWSNLLNIKIERLRNLKYLSWTTIKKYKLLSIFILPYSIVKTYLQVIIKIPKMLKKRQQIQKLVKYNNND